MPERRGSSKVQSVMVQLSTNGPGNNPDFKQFSQTRQNCFQLSLAILLSGNHTSLKAI